MRKSSHLIYVSILISSTQVSYADITPMSSADLDRLTAGGAKSLSASGGAVVGNDSSANISSLGTVTLDSEAQEAAKALNIVNSSESTVANGLNIWDGQLNTSAGVSMTENAINSREVEQSNNISQDQRRVASLPNYSRPDANIEESWDNSGSSSSAATHNEVDSVTDLVTTTRTNNTTNLSTEVNALSTVLGQEVRAGKGIAIAGNIDSIDFAAGTFEIEGTASVGGVLEGAVSFTLTGPELNITGIEAAGCAAMTASCNASGGSVLEETSNQDHSTMYSLDTSSNSSEEYTETGSRLTRSAFEIEGALAEYIVVDNSDLTVSTDYSVNLSGAAQAGLSALNVVNAAGSAVANGVNIGRSDNSTNMAMTQSNVIVHSR